MRKYILCGLIFLSCASLIALAGRGELQASSTIAIQFSFTGATQAIADTKRDAWVIDQADALSTDVVQRDVAGVPILVGGLRQVDATKLPAFRQAIKAQLHAQVVGLRVSQAGAAAAATKKASEDAVGIP